MGSKKETNYLQLQRLITLANKTLVIVLRNRFPNVLKYDGVLQKLEQQLKANVKDPKLLNILFPPGDHYRGDFSELDISYLYHLLRLIGNIKPHNKRWGNDPADTDRSMAANIERIRIIRNDHFHKSDGRLTDEEFRDQWDILSQCILDLGGMTYKPKIDQILISPYNAVTMDNIILEETLKPWREEMKSFVRTDESRIILEACINNQVVVIRGAVGSGKSITTYHAAFNLETIDGYSIFPSNDPENIKQHTCEDGKNIFIFDDIFGKYIFNNFTYDRWKKSISEIIIMLNHNVHLNIINTCRSHIPMPVEFKKLAVRSRFEYQLILSSSDKEKLAEHFCGEFAKEALEDSQYNDLSFFPRICKEFVPHKDVNKCVTSIIETEFTHLKKNDLLSYITLGLLVVSNNLVCKKYFENGCTFINNVLVSLIKECKSMINITPFETENVLYHMKGTYVLENEIGFASINSYMFDCIALCVGKEFCGTILKHSDDIFFRERLVFTSIEKQKTNKTIPIPDTLQNSYFQRVLKMFNAGNVEEALKNVQSSYKSYRCALIQYLQISRSNDQSANYIKTLPVCLKLGYADVADHILSTYPYLLKTSESYEEHPLHLACEYEQYDCAEVLIKHEADVNQESNDFLSPLHNSLPKKK